jgi:hypothetical protein
MHFLWYADASWKVGWLDQFAAFTGRLTALGHGHFGQEKSVLQGIQSPTQFQKRSFIRRTESGSQLLYRKRTVALMFFAVLGENLLLKIR